MNSKRDSQRGQVLIIFVFAAIALIAITGLAIDGANVFSDRRHAQNAADTAALAAALYKVQQVKLGQTGCSDVDTPTPCGAEVKIRALDLALKNGYPGSNVEVHIPPVTGPYAHDGYGWRATDYVQVIINSDVDTFFARVVGIGQLHNQVQAVAVSSFVPSETLYGGNSLVALRPTGQGDGTACPGEVSLSGNALIHLVGGGIFVNSSNPGCAFKMPNCTAQISMESGAILQGIGGPFPGCVNTPTWHDVSVPYPFPPRYPPVRPIPPAVCGEQLHPSPTATDPSDGNFHYQPGHYAQLPPERNVVLEAGVYCVDNLVKTVASTTLFKGDNVFLYIRPGRSTPFSFNGGTVQLTGRTSEPYKGYLLYVDFDPQTWAPSVSAPNCSITAKANSVFKGVIYAPFCDVTINGGSVSVGITSQVIAYTITVDGGAGLTFYYNEQDAPKVPEINEMGLAR